MAEQFNDQGGLAGMDPNPLLRWLTSAILRGVCRPERLQKQRVKTERARRKAGDPAPHNHDRPIHIFLKGHGKHLPVFPASISI